MSLTLAASFLCTMAAQAGPVGSPILINPDQSLGGAPFAIDHNASNDTFLCATLNNGNLRIAGVDAATGAVAAPVYYGLAMSCSIAWNASENRYLLVWGTSSWDHIYALVLDPAGIPVGGAAPFIIDTDQDPGVVQSASPQVSCDGTNWMVVWSRANPKSDIRGRLVGPASTCALPVFASIPFNIAADGLLNQFPRVGSLSSGGHYVAWVAKTVIAPGNNIHTVSAAHVSSAGGPGGIQLITSSSGTFAPASVTANPARNEFILAWHHATTAEDHDVAVRRIAADGFPAAPAVIVDAPPSATIVGGSVTASYNDTAQQVFVTWMDWTYNVWAARLSGPDLSPIQSAIAIASPNSATGTGLACASRAGSTQVIALWTQNSGGAPPHPAMAQRYDLASNPSAPVLAGAVDQFQFNDVTPILQGDTTLHGFRPHATANDVEGGALTLQIEVRETGIAMTGVPTMTFPALSGTPASPWVALVRGKDYHWRARFLDGGGLTSAWVSMGSPNAAEIDLTVQSNAVPTATLPVQLRIDGSALPQGGTTIIPVTFRADVNDADGDETWIEVEIIRSPGTFLGIPTLTSIPGTQSQSSVVYMTLDDGPMEWRWRVVDEVLDSPGWVSYGGSDGTPDFVLLAKGSMNSPSNCLGSSPGGSFLPALLSTALLSALAAARGARAGR